MTQNPEGRRPKIRVDHVGIAVESVADAEPFLTLLGAEKLVHETDPTETFRWAYYLLGDASRVELIEPIDGESSFLTNFLDANGPGLHHVTLEVADIDAVIEMLEAEGVRIVDRTEYDGWTEAFVSPGNPTGVLFQLMEYHEPFAGEHLGPERPEPEKLYLGGERLSEADQRSE